MLKQDNQKQKEIMEMDDFFRKIFELLIKGDHPEFDGKSNQAVFECCQ